MTKDEFEAGYAFRSGLTLERLHELGGHGEPCDCDAGICQGWRMVFDPPTLTPAVFSQENFERVKAALDRDGGVVD